MHRQCSLVVTTLFHQFLYLGIYSSTQTSLDVPQCSEQLRHVLLLCNISREQNIGVSHWSWLTNHWSCHWCSRLWQRHVVYLVPNYQYRRLQSIINAAAWPIFNLQWKDRVTSSLINCTGWEQLIESISRSARWSTGVFLHHNICILH